MNTNSYILPETGHYESIKELLSLLIEHKKGYTLPYEQGIFSAPKDKFEKVRKDDGDYLLIPTNSEYQHLYRGQNFILEEGKKCQPSLYRKLLSKEQQFIEWIRYYEFEAMLKYHPIVRNVFLENDFFVDYSGLAQHYGLLTDKLDFTSDPEIAGFFATCIYNSYDNCYEPITNDKGEGTIYVCHTIMSQFQADSLFNDKLGVIGLQPFKRPGDQKGYSLRLDEEEDLNDQSGIFKYTFDFSKEDSEYFFNHFKQGKKLWSEDPIVSKTWKIKISTLFSMDAVKKAIKFQRVQGFTIKEHYKFLKENGFSIRRKSPFFFNKKETGKIVVNWEHESDLFWESIVQRSVIKDGVKSETITLEDLKAHEMLRITGYRNFDER